MSIEISFEVSDRDEMEGIEGLHALILLRHSAVGPEFRLEGTANISDEGTLGSINVAMDELGLGRELCGQLIAGACEHAWNDIMHNHLVAVGVYWRQLDPWLERHLPPDVVARASTDIACRIQGNRSSSSASESPTDDDAAASNTTDRPVNGDKCAHPQNPEQLSLAKHTLAHIEQAAFAIIADEPESCLQGWLTFSDALLKRAKEIRQVVEKNAVEWIGRRGPVTVGTTRYSVGSLKVVKCESPSTCMQLLLEACNGDVDAVAGHLRSDPFKYGSIRQSLGDRDYNRLFKTQTKLRLVDGVVSLNLIATNTAFSRPQRISSPDSNVESDSQTTE